MGWVETMLLGIWMSDTKRGPYRRGTRELLDVGDKVLRCFSRMTDLVKVFRMDLRRGRVGDVNHGVEAMLTERRG